MQIEIQDDQANQRLDRFLRKYCKPYPEVKLGDIFSRIRKGIVKVNEKKSKEAYRLTLGDIVSFDETVLGNKNPSKIIEVKEEKLKNLDPDTYKEQIIYEDTHRIGRNKPSGVVLHGGNKHTNDLSMQDYLESWVNRTTKEIDKNIDTTFKPSFGYRLDKDTSGVLIAAKTYEALQYINKIIRERKIDKEYFTIVGGDFPDHLIIDKPLEKTYNKKFGRGQMEVKKGGLESKTECWNEKTINHPILGPISLVKIKLHTGRMHQIRIHLASEKHPVLGDIVYGNPVLNRKLYKQLKINRQILHCKRYSFIDHRGTNLSIKAPLPKDFGNIIK